MMTESCETTPTVDQHGRSHVLIELSTAEDLSIPLRGSARLRYTCLSVSKRYIALGSNTGAVYIFGKDSLKNLRVVLAEKDSSPVTQVSLGPIDNLLAYSCSNGNIIVVALNIERRDKPDRVRLSTEHVGTVITALQWDNSGSRLFSGDNLGKVSVAFVPSSKAKDLFKQPAEPIARFDSAIVQLDWSDDRLLVSTTTRCYLCNTARQQYSQIGKRLRDGNFGASFFPRPDGQTPTIYCSRPGSRIWEVDFDGGVLNTHQFKQLLAIPSFPVINLRDIDVVFPDKLQSGKAQSLPFPKLIMISEHYLMTWNKHGVYIFDPVAVKVITWTDQIKGVTDIKCLKNEVYIFNESDSQVQRLHLFSVDRCINVLIAKQQWLLAGNMTAYFESLLKDPTANKHLPWTSLSDLYEHLLLAGAMDLAWQIKVVLDTLQSFPDPDLEDGSHGIVRLESGIYQVNQRKRHGSDDSTHTQSSNQSLSRRSSVSSLTAIAGEPKPSIQTETQTVESPGDVVDTPMMVADVVDQSLGAQSSVFSNTSVDSELPSPSINSNHISQVLDILTSSDDSVNIAPAKGELENSVINKDGNIALSENDASGAYIGDQVLNLSNGNTETEHQAAVLPVSENESGRFSPLPERVMRTGSISSLSSISSNEFMVEQLKPEPLAIVAKSENPVMSGKKMLRKKRASQPVILGPGEKIDVKAKSDLGQPSSIQEAILETEKQEPVLQGIITPEVTVDKKTDGVPKSSPSVSMVTASPHTIRIPSPSPRSTGERSPSHSPLTQSWEGEMGDSNSPKTTLKSVKNSLTLKFSSTKKNFMKTIREKKNMFTSKDSSSGMSPSDERVPNNEQEQTSKELKVARNKDGRNKSVETEDTDSLTITPLIDVTDLQRATDAAIRALDNPGMLLDPQRTRAMLNTWLSHLHTALQQLITVQHRDRSESERKRIELEEDRLQGTDEVQQGTRGTDRIEREKNSIERENDSVERDEERIEDGSSIQGPENDLEIEQDSKREEMKRTEDAGQQEKAEQSIAMDMQDEISDTFEDDCMTQTEKFRMPVDETNNTDEVSPILAEGERPSESPFSDDIVYPEDDLPNTSKTSVLNSTENEADTISIDSGLPIFESQNTGEDENSDVEGGPTADLGEDETQMFSSAEGDSVIPVSSYSSGASGSYTGSLDTHMSGLSEATQADNVNTTGIERLSPNKNCDTNSKAFPVMSDQSNCDTNTDAISIFDFSKICYITDPFQAGKDLSAKISKLVNFSFELGIHNNVSRYLMPTKDTPTDALSSDERTAKLASMNTTDSKHPHMEEASSASPVLPPHPAENDDQLSQTMYGDTCTEEKDLELSLFLRCYFSFLDVKRVRKSFNCHNLYCYKTWLALVDCLKEASKHGSVSGKLTENNTNGAFDLLRSGILPNRDAILGHVARLFEVSVSRTVEFCLEEVKEIFPLDVLNMCKTSQKPTPQVFLSYMLKRLVQMGAVPQQVKLAELCENREVRVTWLTHLLERGQPSHLKDEPREPLPGSHLHPWKHKSIINAILDQFLSTDSDQFLKLCQQNGYWLGSLELLKHRDRLAALQLIVKLGDVKLLALEGCCPETTEEWQCILQAMMNVDTCTSGEPASMDRGGHCADPGTDSGAEGGTSTADRTSNTVTGDDFKESELAVGDKTDSHESVVAGSVDGAGSPSLTWDSVALLLAQSVGPTNAISLLENVSLPDNSLSLSFYQAMIVSALTVERQRSLLHGILEKTDAYLWAKKPPQMAPQLLYAVEEETKTVAVGREGGQTQVFKDMFTQLESQPDFVTYRFVEDPECHWGIASDINSDCPCCGLAITEQVSLSQPGLIIFHCGHGYHKFCHQEKTCTVCSDQLDSF